jgi:hypothetical protein
MEERQRETWEVFVLNPELSGIRVPLEGSREIQRSARGLTTISSVVYAPTEHTTQAVFGVNCF